MFSYMTSCFCVFFFFKQKTAYEMRISDWSSDVCSSDLYYFYQAAWRTDVPVLHLTGKRYTDRAYRSVDVRAYSNQPRERLSVNGRDIGWTNCKIGRASCRERVCQYV